LPTGLAWNESGFKFEVYTGKTPPERMAIEKAFLPIAVTLFSLKAYQNTSIGNSNQPFTKKPPNYVCSLPPKQNYMQPVNSALHPLPKKSDPAHKIYQQVSVS